MESQSEPPGKTGGHLLIYEPKVPVDQEELKVSPEKLIERKPDDPARSLCQPSPDPKRGDILAALRRSPLVGAELEIDRPVLSGRKIEL